MHEYFVSAHFTVSGQRTNFIEILSLSLSIGVLEFAFKPTSECGLDFKSLIVQDMPRKGGGNCISDGFSMSSVAHTNPQSSICCVLMLLSHNRSIILCPNRKQLPLQRNWEET